MNQNPAKLPGYEKAKELIALYKKAGFCDEEIASEMLEIEKLILGEIFADVQEKMSREEKERFERLLLLKPTPEEIARWLKLDANQITEKINSRLQSLIDEFKEKLAASDKTFQDFRQSFQ